MLANEKIKENLRIAIKPLDERVYVCYDDVKKAVVIQTYGINVMKGGKVVKKKCCFCGGNYGRIGNNPYPASKNEDDRCCDMCNSRIVLPARLQEMFEYHRKQNA